MRTAHPILAYIALGSNLGDREKNLAEAIALVKLAEGIVVKKVSRIVQTKAVGGPADSPDYLNAAAEIETTLGSHALLHCLLDIEKVMGRVRREKWEPRVIDLDVLLYGNQIISSQELIVPHPLMHEREFVLGPLCDLNPKIVHPTLQMTVSGLLENLRQKSQESGHRQP